MDGYFGPDGEYLLIAEDGENLRTRQTPVAFLARDKFWVNNHAHIVRATGEADTCFLMYALATADISGYLTGSTMPKLTQGNMNRIPLPAPPVNEQRAIAHILGTLDDKIELNRRMNETLEAMARALFKSWFVDFDPVRAKMEGETPASPSPLSDLFPDSFEDSELGEVPRGWKARSLYETAEFINEAAFKSEDFCEPGFGLPIVKIAELKDGVSAQTKSSDRVPDPKQLIDTGELLYSWSGSPDTSLDAFLWTRGRGLLNQHIFKVVTPTIAQKRFVYYLLKFLKPTLVEIARNKQTTGLGHVTVSDMKKTLIASDGVQARIGSLGAGKEWFKPWRTITGRENAPEELSDLEVVLKGVFDKRRFLNLVRHFIVFEDEGGGKLVKKMAGYHQFHAVNVAVEETLRAARRGAANEEQSEEALGHYTAGHQPGGEPGDRRVGVVWHTQVLQEFNDGVLRGPG